MGHMPSLRLAFCGAASAAVLFMKIATTDAKLIHLQWDSFGREFEAGSKKRVFNDSKDIARSDFQEAVEAWNMQLLHKAVLAYKRSAQRGHQVGEYCYRRGLYYALPPSDFAKAMVWYKRGARLLHQASTTALGKLHFDMAYNQQRNDEQAAADYGFEKAKQLLFRTAAAGGGGGTIGGFTGDSLAQWFLAEIYFNAGASRKAVRWWKRCAENGDTDAMMRLAQVFSEGAIGIPKEFERARHWQLAAAGHGYKAAVDAIDWSVDMDTRPVAERRWLEDFQNRGWF